MAVRTTSALVQGILMDDYGPRLDGSSPDLTPYIASASVMVDRVATCATARSKTLTSTELELMERWVAAHAYKQSDQAIASESTLSASVSYQGQTGMKLEGTKYGQMALSMDPSGCLSTITSGRRATAAWLGKPPSGQIPYSDRD